MRPILFSLDRFVLPTYTVVMLVTLAATLSWLAWQQHRQGDGRFDAALLALIVGALGGRLAFILTQWDYYAEQPERILSINQGGISWHAAVLSGLLALIGYAAATSGGSPEELRARPRLTFPSVLRRVTSLLGVMLPALALGLLGGWLACLLAGCAYGQEIPPPQRPYTVDWPDLYGVYAYRLPTQLLGLLLASMLLLLSGRLSGHPGLFLVLLGAGDFLVGFTRGDSAPVWGPLRAAQWADVILVVCGLALEWATLRHARHASHSAQRIGGRIRV